MENAEFVDAQEHNPEIVKNEEVDGDDDELIYEDVEYLEEEVNILPIESNETLSVLSLDHEDVGVAPLQGKITLANLHEALSFQSDQAKSPLNSFEALAMQPGQSKSPSNQRRISRAKKSSPNTVKRRSSRIAKQNLKQASDKSIYPTAKGSNKQMAKKPTTQVPRKRKSSRSRSRTASSTAKKSKSRSLSRKASSTAKKARSSSHRRQMKK